MTDVGRGTGDDLELRDEDRLPWLEAVDEVDEEDGISPLKLIGLVVAGLVAIGVIIGGIYWWQGRQSAATDGDGTLIAAQEGDYKVKPDDPGGMRVEGRGDTQFATSAGESPRGAIDLDALPEAPVARPGPTAADAAAPKAQAPVAAEAGMAVPRSGGRLEAAAPTAQPGRPTRAAPAGALIQLGAFSSEAAAKQGWTRLSRRFAFLAPLGQSVERAEVAGATVYRLRANAGTGAQARDFCGRLQVGGENCLVVN